jgi:hypothetical protein
MKRKEKIQLNKQEGHEERKEKEKWEEGPSGHNDYHPPLLSLSLSLSLYIYIYI